MSNCVLYQSRSLCLARVFLSYAREDRDAAGKLAASLGEAGHQVWWDRYIRGGSRFGAEIDRQLADADAVVVLWSPASVESSWVQDEAAEARDSGRLIPIAVDGCRPPLGFRQFHTISASTSSCASSKVLDQLLEALGNDSTAPIAKADARKPFDDQKGASVCVLPFVNMSGDPEQEYFSDGITEDITTDLSKVSALAVTARNTAFTFKGRSVNVHEIAESLGVSHVVEGSVRKSGNRVRISAQLVDGNTGDQLWAERYDRELTDIFAIQDELSSAIVAALQVRLLPEEKSAIQYRGTSNVDAYNLYLMARQQWVSGAYGDYRRDEAVVRISQQAIALDGDYAEAWALMSLAQSELKIWRGMDANALPAAERALELNPNLAEPYCVKARALEEEGNEEDANACITRALALSPESWEVNREAARMMYRQGRLREAARYFEKAASLDDTDCHNMSMALCCYNAFGDKEHIERAARVTIERSSRAVASDPTNAATLTFGALALGILGEHDRAKDWVRRALLIDPENLDVRYNSACLLVNTLNDVQSGIDVLEAFLERVQSKNHIKHLEADPDLNGIRTEPRFQQMLATRKSGWGSRASAHRSRYLYLSGFRS